MLHVTSLHIRTYHHRHFRAFFKQEIGETVGYETGFSGTFLLGRSGNQHSISTQSNVSGSPPSIPQYSESNPESVIAKLGENVTVIQDSETSASSIDAVMLSDEPSPVRTSGRAAMRESSSIRKQKSAFAEDNFDCVVIH